MARNFVICCVLQASVVVVRLVATDSRNRIVLRGQLYIGDCKGEGNTLKPYVAEKKTVVVFKTLVLERAWAPNLVHPRVFKSCLPLTSRM